MRSHTVLSVLALAGSAVADDVLYSRRLTKRGIDANGNYNMSFFHVNDIHAHLDEYQKSGTDCEKPEKGCYGGYARIKSKVDELRADHPDNLWLNAGDEFQGTLFYSFYGGEKIAETLNELKFDAMTLGNHEWDGGDEKLGEFLVNLTFPVVACNVKSEYENLNKTIKNYHIFKNHNLAVIGTVTDTTPSISHVGNKTTFLDPIAEVQRAVWEIRNTTDVKRIVALTHIGYDIDQKLAKETEGLSLIIGGHSHTLLGDMKDAEGKYPTIVKDKNGDEVFIVTSYRWGEYLGYIDLTFDKDGKALAYHGGPIHMDNKTSEDKELKQQIKSWRGPFEKFAAENVGFTKEELDQTQCQKGDCLLGQVMSDAMLEYRLNQTQNKESEKPDFALINAGGVRATIGQGDITRGGVLTSFPFGNSIVQLEYTGSQVRSVLEGAVSRMNQKNNKPVTTWFQVSKSLAIEYNPNNKNGSKLISAKVDGTELEDGKKYRVVTLDFLAGGGDNIFEQTTDFITLDTQDEVLISYFGAHNPLEAKLEKRVVTTDTKEKESGNDDKSNGNGNGNGQSQGGAGGNSAAYTTPAPVFAVIFAIVIAVAIM